ncbi:hypothetical protein EXU48_24340 [Occultella glacieicola]|uniref:Uncharacterized protein n=1 Tax=Occultella glacieicola TaxID=2518684 RepID=A0ABY2DWB1_9MICO|nr:hypothetical protein [Occultella glacieicola]TDE88010.1 hypothetical protein EXU48_24340 [Occultella glacieicola]
MSNQTEDGRAPSGAEPTPPEDGARDLDLRVLIAALMGGTLALVAINLVLKALSTPERPAPYVGLFDVNLETNLPTMWNASLLLGVGTACLLVAGLNPRHGRLGWIVAAVLALALATDEVLKLHERLRAVGAWLVENTPASLPTYSWVLPGLVIALGGIALVWWWTARKPHRTAWLLRIAVLMYGLGAVVVEAFSGWIEGAYGVGAAYAAVTALEEGLEMSACVVAIVAALRMLRVLELGSGPRAFFVPAEVPASTTAA